MIINFIYLWMMASNAYLETYLKLMILLILYLYIYINIYEVIYIYNRTQRPILYIYINERTNLIYGCGIFLGVKKNWKTEKTGKKIIKKTEPWKKPIKPIKILKKPIDSV